MDIIIEKEVNFMDEEKIKGIYAARDILCNFCENYDACSNEGVVQSRLQVLHVHVFFVAPLGARHMAEPGTDQHQGGVAIGECPHHTGAPTDLTVQPLDHIVGTDARPMLAGKIAVSQSFLNAVLDLFGGLLQFHRF